MSQRANAWVDAVFEVFGGREQAWTQFDKDIALLEEVWNRDTDLIGRILRGHLFVEHFLGEYISRRNPGLGRLEEARLSFTQKVSLVGDEDAIVRELLPGIRHLNTVRNRVAHRLAAALTGDDAGVFLRIEMFRVMRDRRFAPNVPSTEPIDVLEDFSQHAGIMLDARSSKNRPLWEEAARRVNSADEDALYNATAEPLKGTRDESEPLT